MNDNQGEILTAEKLNVDVESGVSSLGAEIDQLSEQHDSVVNRYMRYGKVPVFYVPKRSWVRKNKYETASIKERLENASTPEEVNSILEIGRAYKSASHSTIRRWERLATQKLRELGV